MDVILTAGGKPQTDEALFNRTQGGYKALLDVAGKTMICRVLDALVSADGIDRIVIIGLPPEIDLDCPRVQTILPDRGGMLENIRAGVEALKAFDPNDRPMLVVSSDLPALSRASVEWVVQQVLQEDHDFYYNVIERKDMERVFPGSRRTYIHLADGEYCGGDANAFHSRLLLNENAIWQELVASRKNPIKQAAIVGYDTLFRLLTRTANLSQAERMISKHLGLNAKALRCPYPELGMDVDKPFQLDLMVKHLAHSEQTKNEE